ncbi:MAG TPA: hypothetical protein DHV17_04325 [Chitinophagaceae bacterium]|nr:hypothetical protein [Chitinophagaceae bacterium]
MLCQPVYFEVSDKPNSCRSLGPRYTVFDRLANVLIRHKIGNNIYTHLLYYCIAIKIYQIRLMVTVISASNREDNNTRKVAQSYQDLLTRKGVDSRLLSLDEVQVFERNAAFLDVEKEYLVPADKFIIVMPEYNGSYPGILKLMIDNSDINRSWKHKKVLLTGVSTGRAGNLRGMEHLTGSLMHMNMIVHPNRLPISRVDTLLDENDEIMDPGTIKAVDKQVEEFLAF